MLEGANPEVSSIVMQNLLKKKPLPFAHYDMQLKDEILDKIEITLSPSVSDAEKNIIQVLIEKYAPKAKMKDSFLGKLVRMK